MRACLSRMSAQMRGAERDNTSARCSHGKKGHMRCAPPFMSALPRYRCHDVFIFRHYVDDYFDYATPLYYYAGRYHYSSSHHRRHDAGVAPPLLLMPPDRAITPLFYCAIRC